MLPSRMFEGLELTARGLSLAVCLKSIEISFGENWSTERMSLFLKLPFIVVLPEFLVIIFRLCSRLC